MEPFQIVRIGQEERSADREDSPPVPSSLPGADVLTLPPVRTVADIWRAALADSRDYAAYLIEEGGEWHEVSWAEAGRRAEELAAGFLALGVAKGDRVAILGRSSLEWTLCDFALVSIGAVPVPIYPTNSGPECAYILENSGAQALVVEDAEQEAKLAPHLAGLAALEQVITMAAAGVTATPLADVAARGASHLAEQPSAVDDARRAVGEEDVLTIVYTSGTTGPPKGCVLLHRNYWVMVDMVEKVPDFWRERDVAVLFLPLAHVFGRLVEFGCARRGITIAFCPDPAKVGPAVAAVRPTILPSVPRVYEKVHAGVTASFAKATGAKRKLIDWALGVGYRASECRERRRPYPPLLALQHALADRLVFSKVRAKLGGRLRLALSGGAPLGADVCSFFHALGIPILEGYGLTECGTAATLNHPRNFRIGKVGLPFEGCEVKIAEDGEILIRGENVFAGYYGDEDATRAVLTADGWLRSGDVGSIDEDGFLAITDRKKDLIITAGGKKISPQNIENALKVAPLVSQALVVGDRRPYVTALVTVDRTEAAMLGPDEVRVAIDRAVASVNETLGRVEQIKRFALLPRDFSAEEGEVTPTLKLRRRVCEEHFRAEIEALYDGTS